MEKEDMNQFIVRIQNVEGEESVVQMVYFAPDISKRKAKAGFKKSANTVIEQALESWFG